MIQNREKWGSKVGFVLAAAGSAIGLGNIWKFPYIAGENGRCFICVGLFDLYYGHWPSSFDSRNSHWKNNTKESSWSFL